MINRVLGAKHHCWHSIDGFTPSFIHYKHPSWCLPVTYKYVCERKDQTFIGRNLLSSALLHVISQIRFLYKSAIVFMAYSFSVPSTTIDHHQDHRDHQD